MSSRFSFSSEVMNASEVKKGFPSAAISDNCISHQIVTSLEAAAQKARLHCECGPQALYPGQTSKFIPGSSTCPHQVRSFTKYPSKELAMLTNRWPRFEYSFDNSKVPLQSNVYKRYETFYYIVIIMKYEKCQNVA